MKLLDEIISKNIGRKKYLKINIYFSNCRSINLMMKDKFFKFMKASGANVQFSESIHSLPSFVLVDRNKNVFYKIEKCTYKQYGHPNTIDFSPSWAD